MSAREKYRRPSIFAIFLGMLVGLAYQATHVQPRVPQFHLPDLRRVPVLGKLFVLLERVLRPPAAALSRIARAAWASLAPRLPRVKLPALKKPQLKLKRPSLPPNLKASLIKKAAASRAAVTTAAGAFARNCSDINCRVRARRRMLLVPSILIGLGVGLFVGLPLLVPSAVVVARQQSQALVTQAGALLAEEVIYKVNVPSQPQLLDPQMASTPEQIGHLRLVYEGLTRLNYRMETVPAAASEWIYSPDGLQVVFTLREGLEYSDGTPLNAKRFEYAMLRALDPRLSGKYAALFDVVEGAQAYRTAGVSLPEGDLATLREAVQIKARALDGSLCASYEQADCLKLHVTLGAPDYAFHTRVSSWIAYPLKEESITPETFLLLPAAIAGNGPFAANKLDFTAYSEFVPNTRYWGKKPAYSLHVYYVAETAAALEQYKAGTLDVLPLSSPADLNAVLADGALSQDLRRQAGSCVYGIFMDPAAPPFDDFNVRAAFAQSINRDAYVREVLEGQGAPALTWVPAGLPGHNPAETRFDYNPAQARQLLADSRYHESGLPSITVQYADTPTSNARWSWLRDRWQDVLGVTILLDPQPAGAQPASPLEFRGWCGDYPDPSGYLSYWPAAGASITGQLGQAALQPDPAERLRLYEEAQGVLLGDVPVIVLNYSQQAYLFRPDLLPNGTPFDAIFPVDVDPAAFQPVADKKYLPLVGK